MRQVGGVRHEFRSISPEHAHSVMGAGEPNSGGVAYALMEGDFSTEISPQLLRLETQLERRLR